MADAKENIKAVKEEIKGFNQAGVELVTVLQDIAKVMSENAKAASEFSGEAAETFKEDAKASVDLAKELQGYTLTQLKDKRSLNAFNAKLEKVEKERAKTQSRINFLEQKLITAKGEEAKLIKESIKSLGAQNETIDETVKKSEELKSTLEEINKKAGFFDNLSELVGDIPVLNKVFKEFGNASKAARDAAAEGGDAMKAGANELGKAAAKAMRAFTIATLRKGLLDADERAVSLGRNLNMTTDAARQTVRQFNRFSESTKGLTGADLQNSLTNISDTFGITADLSNESASSLATMTKYLGMSAEESAKLAKFSAATGQEVEDVTENLIGEVQILNARNKTGVKYQAVLKDVAGASDAIKLSTQGSGRNLNKAAFEAKRLGLSLTQVDNIAGSLLNFEESISAELEAELLTGKQLNLEGARRAALNNDLEGVATEIAKQMGSAAEFGKMNRIQQEAMADAVGMTRDELAASLAERAAIQKFGVSNKMALDAELATELKKIDALKAQGKFDEATAARKALIAKTGSEELVRQRENRTLAETQAEAMTKLAQAADALLVILTPIKKLFDGIASISREIMKYFTIFTLSVNRIKAGFTKIRDIIKSILSPFKKVMNLAGKVGEKLGIKSASSAASSAASGASSAAASSTASGASSAVKGASSAASGASSAASGVSAGGGMFSKIGNFFSKLNPKKLLAEKLGPLFGKSAIGNTLKSLTKRIPILSTFIEGIFANQDIKGMIEEGANLKDINQAIGKRVAEGIGGIIGGAGGAAAIQALNIAPGLGLALTPVAAIAGDWIGRNLGGFIADKVGAEGLGDIVRTTFYKEESAKNKIIQAEDFTIKTHPKDTLVMAGGTKLGNEEANERTNQLLEKLISAVERGGNVYMDSTKVGTAMSVGTYKVQ